MPAGNIRAIAAVSNTGYDACWTGHPFAQLNLYAYGQTAWQPCRIFGKPHSGGRGSATRLTGDALRHAYGDAAAKPRRVRKVYRPAWHLLDGQPQPPLRPQPHGVRVLRLGHLPPRRPHRHRALTAPRRARGTCRSTRRDYQAQYATPEACPDNLLLFFHRLPYTYRMRDGRTLLRRIYDDHTEAVAETEALAAALRTFAGQPARGRLCPRGRAHGAGSLQTPGSGATC